LYVAISHFPAIALSPFIRVFTNTLSGDIDGLTHYPELRMIFYATFDSRNIEILFPHITIYWGKEIDPLEQEMTQEGNFDSA